MADRTWVGNGDSANPNKWDNIANWKEGSVPVGGDDVFLRDSAVSILDGLSQPAALVFNSLNVEQSFTGLIGNDSSEFLECAATVVNIGENKTNQKPQGSRRLNLDLKVSTDTINIFQTSRNAQDQNFSPCRLLIAESTCKIYMQDGIVSIADESDQTSTFDELNITKSSARVTVGSGVTFNDFFLQLGTATLFSMPAVTFNVTGGTSNLFGTDGMPSMVIRQGAIVNASNEGTVVTTTLEGTLNLLDSAVPRTYTTLNHNRGGILKYDPAIITITTYVPIQTDTGISISVS